MEDNRPIGLRINEVSRLFFKKIRDYTNKKGISCTYFFIMGAFHHSESDKLTQKQICECTKMKAPTISLTLQSMEEEGYITREKGVKDSRKTYVTLTDKGHELGKNIHNTFKDVDHLMENALTSDELKIFYTLLSRIQEALEKED